MSESFFHLLSHVVYPVFIALGLAAARSLGMVFIFPAFNRLGLNGTIRTSVAIVLSLPVLPLVLASYGQTQFTVLFLAGIVIKEMLIGLVIGLLFGLPFWGAEVAGSLIDLQRGSTMAQLLDPNAVTRAGLTATLLSILMVALFFASGGFDGLLDVLYRSYHLWPIFQFGPSLDQDAAMAVLHMLDRIMFIGVRMMAPLVIAVLAGDLALAYLARIAPNLHVFSLSLALKNLVFAVLMVIYIMFLMPRMIEDLGSLGAAFAELKQFSGS
ncbi:type III secretion system export apparatus subunit SctT [Salinisphaera sp.]|uniref:type III secretion system export apparatus subunit SctT n=1 Tax=Salinisphaera sp. TaxID=1914330 RepID=UPI002D790728|nr:type III secretion system export apparatus subunit SctT [Salinisphaera sp.]HET7314007.1 type III secretion system export apparatus subunit SctT [Salinisphaera sp.]